MVPIQRDDFFILKAQCCRILRNNNLPLLEQTNFWIPQGDAFPYFRSRISNPGLQHGDENCRLFLEFSPNLGQFDSRIIAVKKQL